MRARSSILFGLRVSGAVLFGLLGWRLGDLVSLALLPASLSSNQLIHASLALVASLIGLVLVPALFGGAINGLLERIGRITGTQLVADFIGLGGGLLIAVFLAFPLARLPEPFGQVLPFISAVAFGSFGLSVMNMRYKEVFRLLNIRRLESDEAEDTKANSAPVKARETLLLDTSVIIDGRIADIVATGFVRAQLLVPRMVLSELQHIADSTDGIRRARGRRGLEVLKQLQREPGDAVQVIHDDVPGDLPVDEKLIRLAMSLKCPIMTNDYNLNKVASLQGVTVLNINELANAVKTVLLPGENLQLRIIQEGKEHGQGVGYLEDGTMVVVEDGQTYLNKIIPVTVTKILQTSAGRMIFARP